MTQTPSVDPSQPASAPEPHKPGKWHRKAGWLVLSLLLTYVATAYLVMPLVWDRYMHRHPALDKVPGITQTTVGIPADPINVGLIGTKDEIVQTMLAAKWHSADALSLRSSVEIAADTVLKRPYEDAPVSSLYLFGRKEDLAFEKPVGDDPRRRNHVRFWQSDKADPDGRPVWLGAATFDKGVGLSHTTGEVTHHIAGDIDTERDRLMGDLEATGKLSETYSVEGFHAVKEGRNGGGDPWHTDGNLRMGVIAAQQKP